MSLFIFLTKIFFRIDIVVIYSNLAQDLPYLHRINKKSKGGLE
jgi:hypothetical protein